MSEMKHTPGPWSYVEHNWSDTSIRDKNGNRICLISIEDEATERNQYELEKIALANARLITAAPELLEALEELNQAIMLGVEENAVGIANASMKADVVITKAKGGSSQMQDCDRLIPKLNSTYEKLFQFVEWVKNKKYFEEKEIYCGSQALEFIEEQAEKLLKELNG